MTGHDPVEKTEGAPGCGGRVARTGCGPKPPARGGDLSAVWPDASVIDLAEPFPVPALGLGAELKNTVCAGMGQVATLSGPHGDLADPDNYRQFIDTVRRAGKATSVVKPVVGYDLHPTYLSTEFAIRQPGPKVAIQHHHAHAISCALDAGVQLPIIAVVCDGTGFGTDGASWGGEVLYCAADSFRRLAHLKYLPLPGADAAARDTWRPGMSLLRETFPDQWRTIDLPAFAKVDPVKRATVAGQLAAGLNTPRSSSLGRLFDGVAFLTGLCPCNEREGQAPIALEAAAGERIADPYPFAFEDGDDEGAVIDWRPMIRRIVEDVKAGAAAAEMAARFHAAVVAMFAAAAERAVHKSRIERVVLSGGCFFNKLVRVGLAEALEARGFQVGLHQRVSTGDAGLSLGQALIASTIAAKSDFRARGD